MAIRSADYRRGLAIRNTTSTRMQMEDYPWNNMLNNPTIDMSCSLVQSSKQSLNHDGYASEEDSIAVLN